MAHEIERADVALVYPFFLSESGRKRQYLYPQLGLGSIAAYLKSQGITVALVDGTFSTRDAVVDRVRRLRPGVVGVYSKITVAEPAIDIARRLKGEARLVVGGPHATSTPKDFLDDFEVVVHGEGEITMAELAARMLNGKPYGDVAGISYRTGDAVTRNPGRPLVADLDSLPAPDRGLFENERYQSRSLKEFGFKSGSIITARGCPYQCEYCSKTVFGDTYRTVSADRVIEEMREVTALGYQEIWFADDVFSLKRSRTIDLCEAMVRSGVKIPWTCLCRVDNVDREMLLLMKAAGCRGVIFGIESLSDDVLGLMNKRFTAEQAIRALEVARSTGLEVSSYFMVGYLGDTRESIRKTVNMSSSLPFHSVQYAIPKPLAGTGLAKRLESELGIAKWRNWQSTLTWKSKFSQRMLRVAITKGDTQFRLRRRLGSRGRVITELYRRVTDRLLDLL